MTRLVAAVALALCLTRSALGTVWVDYTPSNAVIVIDRSTVGSTTTLDVTMAQSNTQDVQLLVRGDNDDTLIVHFENDSQTKVLYVTLGHMDASATPPQRLLNLNLSSNNDEEADGLHPVVIQSLTVAGDVGHCQATDLISADIAGNLGTSGDVTLLPRTDSAVSVFGNVVVGGDLLGRIDVRNGGINFLAVGGDIGPGSINPVLIRTSASIRHISAPNGSITADIDANYWNTTGGADIGRILARDGIHQVSTGIKCRKFDDLAGSLFPPGIRCPNGDLDSDITLTAALDREIIIGGSFTSGHTISLPAVSGANGGLRSQITFNNLGASHTWGGDVKVGGTSLTSQPYYTNTATSIGGGSAGLASFQLHQSSCSPQGGSTYPVELSNILGQCVANSNILTLRFYGPVTLVDEDPRMYVEEYVGNGTWVRVGWDNEVVTEAGGDSAHRTIKVKRDSTTDLWSLGQYRLSPRSGKIKCEGVGSSGSEPNVAAFYYYLTFVNDCEEGLLGGFDLNSDQSVDGFDVPTWVASPVDFDASGSADAGDLNSLFNAIDTYQSLPR